MNLYALLFQHLMKSVKETREGSKKMRNWIPLGRLILYILMESKLIYSSTADQITKRLEPLVRKMFNAKGLKNMGIIPELISSDAKIPKEDIYKKRIPLEEFPIFLKPYPLDVAVGFLEKCHACAIIAASETTYKKKRKISKKHFERMDKNFKASKETLDTSTEEPRATGATSSAGTTPSKFIPSEAQSF